MIRKALKKKSSSINKINTFLEKYNLPKTYFNINRKMVTRGVGIGLFWAFIPMPMQMLAVIFTTPFIRFNVPIAISMVWLTNPITMPPIYYMEYITGNFILGREGINNIELTMTWFTQHFSDILVPLYTGATFYSIFLSTSIYIIIIKLWKESVHKEKKEKTNNKLNPPIEI